MADVGLNVKPEVRGVVVIMRGGVIVGQAPVMMPPLAATQDKATKDAADEQATASSPAASEAAAEDPF